MWRANSFAKDFPRLKKLPLTTVSKHISYHVTPTTQRRSDTRQVEVGPPLATNALYKRETIQVKQVSCAASQATTSNLRRVPESGFISARCWRRLRWWPPGVWRSKQSCIFSSATEKKGKSHYATQFVQWRMSAATEGHRVQKSVALCRTHALWTFVRTVSQHERLFGSSTKWNGWNRL